MSRASAFVRLIRPVNCIMMGMAVVVGAALAEVNLLTSRFPELLYSFSTGFLLTGATMAINDYYDRQIDSINEPRRPIPSGLIRPNEALAFAFVLTAAGFIIAGLTSWECLTIASLSWVVFVLYTTTGKRTGLLGNLMVSVCISVPFIYGGFAIGLGLMPAIILFVAMVFFSNTGREITKGIVDVQGDKDNNIRTIAVLYGTRTAALIAAVFYLLAVLLTPIPWFLGIVSFWFLPLVALTDIGLISAVVLLLLKPSRENARRIKNRNLLWFSIGLLAFIAGTFS